MSKKKIGIIAAVVVLTAAASVTGLWLLQRGGGKGSGKDKVYVESVASITNTGAGVQNRYSGVVEPQQSWDVKKNTEKTVKEIFVKEGDQVEAGTPLFEYDTESVKDEIAQAQLELEGLGNQISDYYNQIETLKEERAAVSEDEKFQYTTQIQSIQTSIKQAEYNKESKKAEIAKKEEALKNAVVSSEIAGTVKSISENGIDPNTGQELPFMTVLAVGDYRVKGTVNEQNVWSIPVGSPVLLRSRVDETMTWTGTITEVDTNTTESGNNNGMVYEGGGMETATKYPFYIDLDSAEGLILGQHVYIELDVGQSQPREGLWLYESYLVMEEDGSFVWADDGKHRLKRQKVELGEYDEELAAYEILSGLSKEDYIAFPMNALYEGVATVTDMAEVDYTSPLYQEENDNIPVDEGMPEDDMLMDEGMPEDDMLMDESMPEDDMLMDEGMPEDGVIDDGASNVPTTDTPADAGVLE